MGRRPCQSPIESSAKPRSQVNDRSNPRQTEVNLALLGVAQLIIYEPQPLASSEAHGRASKLRFEADVAFPRSYIWGDCLHIYCYPPSPQVVELRELAHLSGSPGLALAWIEVGRRQTVVAVLQQSPLCRTSGASSDGSWKWPLTCCRSPSLCRPLAEQWVWKAYCTASPGAIFLHRGTQTQHKLLLSPSLEE